jgi:hypothetical protein
MNTKATAADGNTSTKNPIKKQARISGILYLIIFLVAPFPFLVGRAGLVVPGDAISTANNILGSEFMFRFGMVAETIVFLVEIVLAALLYALLRPVNKSLSLAAAFSRVGEAVVQAVNLLTSAVVLLLLRNTGYLTTVFKSDQLSSLSLLFLDANAFGILVWGFLFGLHLLLLGYLVYKSEFWPRILGILLLLGGVGYLAQSFGHILLPQFDDILSVVVIVLAVPGELAFTIWLLVKGVNVEKWEQRYAARSAL